jgi:hypothetical protein
MLCLKGDDTVAHTPNGHLCYDCSALTDYEFMLKYGKISLYLTIREVGAAALYQSATISNWPGTLKFPCGQVRLGNHNMAGTQINTWFAGPDGHLWWARKVGDSHDIAMCRKTKDLSYREVSGLTPELLARYQSLKLAGIDILEFTGTDKKEVSNET